MAIKAANQVAHVFPGGVFTWQFDDGVPISASKYLWDLVKILHPHEVNNIFPKEVQAGLDHANQHDLRQSIFKLFKASTLLILDHVDTLKRAESRRVKDAVLLVTLLKKISSRTNGIVKILATSYEKLGWPGEKQIPLNGFVDSDIKSGYQLFIQNLSIEARDKMKAKENGDTLQLLCDLTTKVCGHPLSLELLGLAASQQQHFNKCLEEIAHEHYITLLADEEITNASFKKHFKSMIDLLTNQQRLLLYMCCLYTGPVTESVLAFISCFICHKEIFTEEIDSSIEAITQHLNQLCDRGLLSREDEEYTIHTGIRQGVRQCNSELKIRLDLPIPGLLDDIYIIGAENCN